jgi:hypothetical protein
MWHWEQGRLEYFQFDVLRRVAQFAVHNDVSQATRAQLRAAIGTPFDPADYTPWRNYARVFKLMFLVAGTHRGAQATSAAALLAQPGQVTADEFFHFVAQGSTEPSPALSGYDAAARPRYPLLFALKYLLAKSAVGGATSTAFDEIIGSYRMSNFVGDEDDEAFIELLGRRDEFRRAGNSAPDRIRRQARESLRVISQISYLHVVDQEIVASIAAEDAMAAFQELAPIGGQRLADPSAEIQRRAVLFRDGTSLDFFDYPQTVVSELSQAGFDEGSKVEKTHLIIERNAKLRAEYFRRFSPTVCDVCAMDTRATYPWTDRVLDLHHKLPLSSGTRVERAGTVFTDLVPVCPSCHRSVHKFYGSWLRDRGQRDFQTAQEATAVYNLMKERFEGHKYA